MDDIFKIQGLFHEEYAEFLRFHQTEVRLSVHHMFCHLKWLNGP